MTECYPVLYSRSADEAGNGNPSDYGVEVRNPALAEILRAEVSGPCDGPGEIGNQFLFRAGKYWG